MLDEEMARQLGFLGTNVESNVTVDWVKTQLADYAKAGDKTNLFRLYQLARHSSQPEIKAYAKICLKFLDGYEEGTAKPADTTSTTPKTEPSTTPSEGK